MSVIQFLSLLPGWEDKMTNRKGLDISTITAFIMKDLKFMNLENGIITVPIV